eukprot:5951422-Pyramimonas_sp.AAC.1
MVLQTMRWSAAYRAAPRQARRTFLFRAPRWPSEEGPEDPHKPHGPPARPAGLPWRGGKGTNLCK